MLLDCMTVLKLRPCNFKNSEFQELKVLEIFYTEKKLVFNQEYITDIFKSTQLLFLYKQEYTVIFEKL